MKKIFNKYLVLMLYMVCTTSYGQVGIKSVGLNLGYYSPSMDYWNDNALSTWSNHFSGDFYGNMNIEIKVIKTVNVRVGVGYWKQELTESGIQFGDELRSDKIAIQMLPLSFDVLIHSPSEMSDLFGLYGGIGTAVNFISMEYTINIPSIGENKQDHSGRNFLMHLIVGVDYKIMPNVALGTEFKYVFSKYKQEVMLGAEVSEENVSINGPQIMCTIKYLF